MGARRTRTLALVAMLTVPTVLGVVLWRSSRAASDLPEGLGASTAGPETPAAGPATLVEEVVPRQREQETVSSGRVEVSADLDAGSASASPPVVVRNESGARVRVVDSTGASLEGVPLVLFEEGRAADDFVQAMHVTDGSGAVDFERLRWEGATYVEIALPLEPPVFAPLLAGSVVELVAPPLGALDLALSDPRGAAVDVDRGILLMNWTHGPASNSFWVYKLAFPSRLRVPLHQGYTFRLSAGEWRPVDGGMWPGLPPTNPVREHRIVLRDRRPVLVGRLLLAGGRPFAGDAQLEWTGAEKPRTSRVSCDVDGAFRWIVDGSLEREDRPVPRLLASSGSGLLDLEVAVELPPSLPAGDVSLGDLVLGERPVLVAGRIEGAPVSSHQSTGLHVYERGPGSEEWSEIPCDADIDRGSGAFLVSGAPRGARAYRVHLVTSKARQVSSGLFEPGDRDFVIRLGARAALRTTLLGGEETQRRDMRLRLDYGESLWARPGTSPALRFRTMLPSLHPGTVDIELRHDSGAVLARRTGVELVPGETTELEIDLRGGLLDVRIQLEYSARDPGRRGVRVLFRESDSGPYDLAAVGRGSQRRILTIASKVDVLVLADWHAPEWLDDVAGDVTCTLRPGASVSVADPDGICRYNDAYSLEVAFTPLDPQLAAVTPPGYLTLHPHGDATATPLPGSGRYRAEWVATIGDEQRILDVREVVVRDGYQHLELPLPLEGLARFRAEMGR